MSPVPNLITVDLDDRAGRSGKVPEIEPVVDGLLDALNRESTTATFFASGTLAEKHGPLLQRIAAAGHELGCLSTTAPSCQAPYCSDFRTNLHATKKAIEEATGVWARGHRAVNFGVNTASEWAYDVLLQEGFEYDSSRFPARYVEPGSERIPRSAYAVRRWSGTLLELPVTTADILAVRVQLGTTGSVRGLPLAFWRHYLRVRQENGDPVVLHLQASDLNPKGLDRRAIDRVSRIVGESPFSAVGKVLSELRRSAPVIES